MGDVSFFQRLTRLTLFFQLFRMFSYLSLDESHDLGTYISVVALYLGYEALYFYQISHKFSFSDVNF